jgi:hypothetical protein
VTVSESGIILCLLGLSARPIRGGFLGSQGRGGAAHHNGSDAALSHHAAPCKGIDVRDARDGSVTLRKWHVRPMANYRYGSSQ